MIIRMLPTITRSLLFAPSRSFIIMKIIKKKLAEKEEIFKPRAQTYSAHQQEPKPKEENKEEDEFDHEEKKYDFFSRQKEIELGKDFRKIREESKFIPEDVGRGGFDEVVYWSDNARSPDQILSMLKVFNRVEVPEVVQDEFRFQEFGSKVLQNVYLALNIESLMEYATFGQKYRISDETFWMKIQEKTLHLKPTSPDEIKSAIDIIFIMSKMGQGDIIFSSLSPLFRTANLTISDSAKLLSTYYNLREGDQELIKNLLDTITSNVSQLPRELFIEMLPIFQSSKTLSDAQEKTVNENIEKIIPELSLKELCLAGEYIGHGKMPPEFWAKVEERAKCLLKDTKMSSTKMIWLIDLASSYSLSAEFMREHFLSALREDNYRILRSFPPEVVSRISKILYIYEMEEETKDVEEEIQTLIIKQYNNLKNVKAEVLLQVIKDYTVTRNGSRELYIFFEEVVQAIFQDFKKDRVLLETLHVVYDKSNLCSASLLSKIEFFLQ